MSHEVSETVSNKDGTLWWNIATVGKNKGKVLPGPDGKTSWTSMEEAVKAAKQRSMRTIKDIGKDAKPQKTRKIPTKTKGVVRG